MRCWKPGTALVGIDSPAYNLGLFFIAPPPVATSDVGAVKLNAVHAPRLRDYVQYAAFGFCLCMPFSR